MNSFTYKAMDQRGGMRRGRMDAANAEELYARIADIGLDLISYKMIKEGQFAQIAKKTISRREVIDFCIQLEQLLSSGVPLLEALSDLRKTTETRALREMLTAIIARIQEGQTFSEALLGYPRTFNEVFTSLVQAGEHSGQLPLIFRSLAEDLKWEDEIIARAKKAVTYPIVVGIVVMAVVVLLMIFLVPQLVAFIKSMGGELPIHTRALLATSAFFVHRWYLVIGMPVAFWLGIKAAVRWLPAARLFIDRQKLKLPLIGDILKKIILARFCKIFALMFQSGISLLQILEITERTVGNKAVALAVSDARNQLSDGASLSQAFENAGIFPPLVLRMIAIGERTGDLDKSLLNVTYFFDRDVKELISRLESAIEPAMTVALGGILGWIMLSVLGPIYDLMSKIK